jgi:C_GCAxxG_C_C family probable redox protein
MAEKKVRQTAEKAADAAYGYSYNGGHCSQSTIRGLMEAYGKADNDIFRAMCAFAGGCGCEGDAGCGAYTAGAYFLGMHFGLNMEDTDMDDPPLKNRGDDILAMVGKLHQRFTETYGSAICERIHRRLFGRPYYLADEDEHNKLKNIVQENKDREGFIWCAHVCRDAARWTVEILEAERSGT